MPSRSFFPRGFLWDEGFHQLLLGAWDSAIADDALTHWLGTMHGDGWIPREQPLGAEAEARVPSEFLPQRRLHANPPTLILRLQRSLDRGGGTLSATDAALARRLWPRLVKWYAWFTRTQAGEVRGSFRWRGRDRNDRKLNAMTLSSGLDDYPRASTPSKAERHVDLHCWITYFARFLGQLARALGQEKKAEMYESSYKEKLVALDAHHWSDSLNAYADWGLHANRGDFIEHVVVKCATNDGRSQIEHDVLPPVGARPDDCPRSHPRLLFPLGDGAGGLLMRERFVPKGLKEQWVGHLGYVSLFPLALRLLPPDAPTLGPLLELLRDPKRLWTPYGIASLSKGDRFYHRANAPGDAAYWRGPIWINLNYLIAGALHHYAHSEGPQRSRAAEIYAELRENLVGNLQREWERSGFLWEQYHPETGAGQRTHPFNGWSALVLLVLAEIY